MYLSSSPSKVEESLVLSKLLNFQQLEAAEAECSASMAVAELTQVYELVKKLEANLNMSQFELCKTLASEIVFSVEKAIWSVKITGSGEAESVLSDGRGQIVEREQKTTKKRKMVPNWSNQVRVSADAGSEMPHDGHSWRKYGQKEILGAKYPRAYYRCTHRKTQGCAAMKQVQKSDENPSLLDVTYLGSHSCSNSPHCAASRSPFHDPQHKLLDRQNSLIMHLDFQSNNRSDLESQSSIFSFPSTSIDWTRPDADIFCSSAIMSPATSGSNCFPWLPCDPELDEIISAAISASETPPVMDADFLHECGSMNTDFQYDASIFFQ